jgi:hypothetical protein
LSQSVIEPLFSQSTESVIALQFPGFGSRPAGIGTSVHCSELVLKDEDFDLVLHYCGVTNGSESTAVMHINGFEFRTDHAQYLFRDSKNSIAKHISGKLNYVSSQPRVSDQCFSKFSSRATLAVCRSHFRHFTHFPVN